LPCHRKSPWLWASICARGCISECGRLLCLCVGICWDLANLWGCL
jgi:hypothetical protein